MKKFLVETYVARADAKEARKARFGARSIASEFARKGTPVRYLRMILLPGDETCFHLFEAASEEIVIAVCRVAGISSSRVVEAVE